MENKQKKSMRAMVSIMLFAMAAFAVSSCSKTSDTFSSQNSQTANNESTQESTTDETDDLATSAMGSDPSNAAGGRSQTISDDRLACDGTTVVFSNVSTDKTSGTVTITFGPNGCTDKKGNVRKGQIVVTWSGGKWFHLGSSHTIAFTNYSVNGVTIAGTRTVTCTDFTATSATVFSVTWSVSADHTLTWPDKTTATRHVNKSKTWSHTATDDTFSETNGPSGAAAASGTNRHGRSYTMTIASPLTYLGSCIKSSKVFIPTSGIKVITDTTDPAKSKTLTIDFGTGTCDNTFKVTVDGASKTLAAKNDSSGD